MTSLHVLKILNMLSFDNFVKFANVKLICKCLLNLALQVISDFVSASSGNCMVPLHKSSLEQIASSVQGINMQNSLPTELKLASDLHQLKLKLKTDQ